MDKNLKIITGNDAVVAGALAGGAEVMFGYPITPATEILHGWVEKCRTDASLDFLQTEDETSAGFGVIGALLAGKKAFTASAGPGHILLQDPVAMAENLRLPFVGVIMQRGGPSTGTVNFSQQEVNLAINGGNGNGLRIVYSASSIQEIYELTAKAFSSAWKYRFPTFVLGDGYLGKMAMATELSKPIKAFPSEKILKEEAHPVYLRNCYSSEESFSTVINCHIAEWEKIKNKVTESEKFRCKNITELVISHGIVAEAVKDATSELPSRRIGLFRPITLSPFPEDDLRSVIKHNKITKIYIIESALSQLAHLVKYALYGLDVPVVEISRPSIGFTHEDIVEELNKNYHD